MRNTHFQTGRLLWKERDGVRDDENSEKNETFLSKRGMRGEGVEEGKRQRQKESERERGGRREREREKKQEMHGKRQRER